MSEISTYWAYFLFQLYISPFRSVGYSNFAIWILMFLIPRKPNCKCTFSLGQWDLIQLTPVIQSGPSVGLCCWGYKSRPALLISVEIWVHFGVMCNCALSTCGSAGCVSKADLPQSCAWDHITSSQTARSVKAKCYCWFRRQLLVLSAGYRKLKTASEKWVLNSCLSACSDMSRIVACLISLQRFFNLQVNWELFT